jgi:hypothetical protein
LRWSVRRLYRSNTHYADPVRAGCCHDGAGFRGAVEKLQRPANPANWRCTARPLAPDAPPAGVRVADAGQAPPTDQTFANQSLENRPDMLDKGFVGRHAAGGIGPLRDVALVGRHVRVEKKRSSRGSRSRWRLPSMDRRRSGSIASGEALPRLHLLVIRTSGRRPAKASSNVVSPHTIPMPPPPKVSAETRGTLPKLFAAWDTTYML